MTAGADDANGAQSSLHTLESGGMLATGDVQYMMEHLMEHCLFFIGRVQFMRDQCTCIGLKCAQSYQTTTNFNLTIKPRGPFGPCIPAGPMSPGGPWRDTNVCSLSQWIRYGEFKG